MAINQHFITAFLDQHLKTVIENESHETQDYIVRLIYLRTLLPETTVNNQKVPLYPRMARDAGITYGAEVQVAVSVTEIKTWRTATSEPISAGIIPIMLGSSHCWLSQMNSRQRVEVGECPADPLGYFVIKGSEKLVIIQESLRHSLIYTAPTKGGDKSIVTRMTCVSRNFSTTVVSVGIGGALRSLEIGLQCFAKGLRISVLTLYRILLPRYDAGVEEVADISEPFLEMVNRFVEPANRDAVRYALQSSIFDDQVLREDTTDRDLFGHLEFINEQRIRKYFSPDAFKKKGASGSEEGPAEIKKAIPPQSTAMRLISDSFSQIEMPMPEQRESSPREKYSTRIKYYLKSIDLPVSEIDSLISNLDLCYLAYAPGSFDPSPEALQQPRESCQIRWAEYLGAMMDSIQSPEKREAFRQLCDTTLLALGYEYLDKLEKVAYQKCLHVAMMTAQMCEYLIGKRPLEDRDSWINKQLRLPAQMMGDKLIMPIYQDLMRDVIVAVSGATTDGLSARCETAALTIRGATHKVGESCETAFNSNSWGVGDRGTEENITDTLKRDTPMDIISQVARINTPANRRAKQPSIRMVQPSQVGAVCLFETPEGAGTGLVKNAAMSLWVSRDRDPRELMHHIRSLHESGAFLGLSEVYVKDWKPLLINGLVQFWIHPLENCDVLRHSKRYGLVKKDICITGSSKDSRIEVYTTGGRTCRPLLVVDQESGKLMIDLLDERRGSEEPSYWSRSFNELTSNGCIELLDVREIEDLKLAQKPEEVRQRYSELKCDISVEQERMARSPVAPYRDLMVELFKDLESGSVTEQGQRDIREAQRLLGIEPFRAADEDFLGQCRNLLTALDGRLMALAPEVLSEYERLETRVREMEAKREHWSSASNKLFTHSEMMPYSIFSLPSSLGPLANHMPGSRVAYQAGMSKQALSGYHTNHHLRFDSSFKILNKATRALFEPNTASLARVDVMPTGQMVTVCYLARENNGEDAIYITEEAIAAGKFSLTKYFTKKTSIKKTAPFDEHLELPEARPGSQGRYDNIGPDGLPKLDAYLRTGDCVIAKVRRYKTGDKATKAENASIMIGVGEEGYVDRVWVGRFQGVLTVKVKMRHERKPIKGDKFAMRYSQKGVIGKIVSADSMPRVSEGPNKGLVADMTVNPHGMPSRMTWNLLAEIMASKAAVLLGERVDATAFGGFNEDRYKRALKFYGLDPSGKEFMEHPDHPVVGMGTKLQRKVYMGPVYYQVIKHLVSDKVQVRARGGIEPISHQPVRGRSHAGGIRLGEMERDAGLSHGAMGIINERLFRVSDYHRVIVCMDCDMEAASDASAPTINGVKPPICRFCNRKDRLGVIEIPYVMLLIKRMAAGAGIKLEIMTAKPALREDVPEDKFTN